MAGETIRDVVIRCSIKLGDGNVFNAIAAQMKQVVTTLAQQLQISQTIQRSEQSLAATQKEKLTIVRDQGRIEITRERSISQALKLEEQRLSVQKQMQKLQQSNAVSASLTMSGGLGSRSDHPTTRASTPDTTKQESGKSGSIVDLFDKVKGAYEIVKGIPDTLESIASGDWIEEFAVLGLRLVEGMEAVVISISKLAKDLLIAGATYIADMIRSLPGGKWLAGKLDAGAEQLASWKGIKGTLASQMRTNLENSGIDAGPTIEEKARAKETEKMQKIQKLEQERIDMIRKLIPAESELLKIAKEKLNSAKQELGMMTRREQEGVLDIANIVYDEKGNVRTGGMESLQKEQLDMVRHLTPFKRALESSANLNAETPLAKAILKRSGIQGEVDSAQAAQDKLNREAVVRINDLNFGAKFDVNVDPKEIVKKFEEQGRHLAEELKKRIAQAVQEALERQRRIAHNAQAGS